MNKEQIEKHLGRGLSNSEKAIYDLMCNNNKYILKFKNDSFSYELKKSTNTFTSDGQEVFEGDYIEIVSAPKGIRLRVGATVEWDDENKEWKNLLTAVEGYKTIKLDKPSKNMNKLTPYKNK